MFALPLVLYFSLCKGLYLIRDALLPFLEIYLADYKYPSPSSYAQVLEGLGSNWRRICHAICCSRACQVLVPLGSLWMCLNVPPAAPWMASHCWSLVRGRTAKGPLTRKHNKRRRMKPSRVKMQIRIIAQDWSSAKVKYGHISFLDSCTWDIEREIWAWQSSKVLYGP